MQSFPPDSPMFAQDQRVESVVELWDTPFTPLRNDIASGGIICTMREPNRTADWSTFVEQVRTAGPTLLADFADADAARTVIDEGRVANLVGYWAGGAPGYHGASQVGKVAYHFECYVRSGSGRDWFNSNTSFTATVMCAGNGIMRVVHNGTNLINVTMDEKGWLDSDTGGPAVSAATTFTTGDRLDFYYLQDQTTWGGFVFKLAPGNPPTTVKDRLTAMREAAVIGCGLMDDNDPPPKQVLTLHHSVEVTQGLGQTSKAQFKVPLANTATWDGIGWQWVRAGGDAAGFLRMHDFAPDGGGVEPVTIDLKRQRLLRIRAGFHGWDDSHELYNVFTGFTDDFHDAASGDATVTCLGVEQRLADQFVKNYPDKISYMTYGYHKLSGTSQPVWAIPAYDNWPLEFALRDLLVRAGIDEGRTRAPLAVPQPDGSTINVVM